MDKYYFEDMPEGFAIELGSLQVSKESIIAYAREYDPQPFHVDEELAKHSLYGGLIASGWHTASLYMKLLVTGFLLGTSSMGSPGMDELRWLKPVRPEDTLSGRFVVVEATPSKSRPYLGIIKGRGEMVNQEGEVVMTLLSFGFFRKREA